MPCRTFSLNIHRKQGSEVERKDAAWTILTRYSDVAAFVGATTKAADSDKESLGFFPGPVFEEFARKDQLFVAVWHVEGERREYAGHLLFNASYPTAHIRQIFVLERHRGQGLGTLLLDELKNHLTELQFISIRARVREDLHAANAFWDGQRFYTQRLAPGGSARKKLILERSHELSTPQLFASSGINQANPFGLRFASPSETPLYLLDLNVLFDLGRRRHRHEDVVAVFRAERMQACQLAISSEIDAELARTATPGKTDPMVDLTSILPKFDRPTGAEAERLERELAVVIFPERHAAGTLEPNDLSDVRHLATAIFHGLHGLITSDGSVLDAAVTLRDRFGIDVLSPAGFTLDGEVKASAGTHGTEPESVLVIDELKASDEEEVRALLTGLDVGRGAQAAEWGAVNGNDRVCHRHAVRVDSRIVGYLVWPNTLRGAPIDARLAIDERSPAAADAVFLVLAYLTEQVAPAGVAMIRLRFPARQAIVREVAAAVGFAKSTDGRDELQKLTLNGIVTPDNWSGYREALLSTSKVRLPTEAPEFRSVDQQIAIHSADGNRVHLSLLMLESRLAPALFCLPGRTATLTPLRRAYAEHLLGHLPQASLLPQPRARLFKQRHFINGAQARSAFTRGGLIAFYESGKGQGLAAVVALARVVHSYQREEVALKGEDFNPSVLDSAQLSSIGTSAVRTVTAFDNLQLLPRPVPLSVLRKLGCGTATQLLTSRRLTDKQLQGILREALN